MYYLLLGMKRIHRKKLVRLRLSFEAKGVKWRLYLMDCKFLGDGKLKSDTKLSIAIEVISV